MKRLKFLLLIGVLCMPGVMTPKAKAFEPITMALLAPVALKVYEAAEPRLVRGAKYGGKKLIQMGVNVFEILYLPLGLVQVTLGAPFGYIGSGIKNITKGFVAPGKLILNTLAFPFTLMGVDL